MVGTVGYFGPYQLPLKEMLRASQLEGCSVELYEDQCFGVGVDSKIKGEGIFQSARDNSLVVFDGEIYNKDDLTEWLGDKGHGLSTGSCAELFASLYLNRENSALSEIRGKFSVALFDQAMKSIVLIRDRLGQCPMYYTFFNKSLIFSSEIRCILRWEEISREVDPTSLGYYLSFGHVPAPRTIFKGIHKVPPGCILQTSLNGAVSTNRYWDPATLEESDAYEEKSMVQSVYQQIMDNVKLRSKDIDNAGVLLSGGLDSATIAAFLKMILGDDVSAFSMVYEDTYQNEMQSIEKIVEYLGINHRTKVLKSDAVDENLIRRIVELYGEPCANSSVLPSYFAAGFSGEYVPTVFTGDGGDEAFLGYSSVCWKEPKILEYYSKLGPTKKLISSFVTPVLEEITKEYDDRRLAIALDFFERKSMSDRDPQIRFAARHLARFFAPEHLVKLGLASDDGNDGYSLIKEILGETAHDMVNKKDFAIMSTGLIADTCKAERSSAAFSVRMRSPLLDHKLMEFALSIPVSLRFKNEVTKYLLRKMLSNYRMLPHEIISSTSKRGFEAPVEVWLKKDLKGLAHTKLVEEKPSILKRFSKRYIEKLLARRDRYSALKVWNLLLLSIWYDIFIREHES